jgi:hypothetical protein
LGFFFLKNPKKPPTSSAIAVTSLTVFWAAATVPLTSL